MLQNVHRSHAILTYALTHLIHQLVMFVNVVLMILELLLVKV
jgi:hypothetical protein